MKILHVSTSQEWYGAEIILLQLLKGDKNNEHIVLAPNGPFFNILQENGIHCIICNELKKIKKKSGKIDVLYYFIHLFNLFKGAVAVLRHVFQIKPDIVQVLRYTSVLYIGFVYFFYQKPIILWQHDILGECSFFNKFLLYFKCGFCNKIIAVSNAVSDDLNKCGVNKKKIQRIYNGIDLDFFQPSKNSNSLLRKEYNIKDDVIILAMIAAIVPWKGHDIVISAAESLVKSGNKNKWIIFFIGGEFSKNDSYKNYLEKKIKQLGLQDNIYFTGKRQDVKELYNNIDILINASISPEPFGISILEGMAMKCIVIASDAAGPSEIIKNKETGLLVPPSEPKYLTEAITYAMHIINTGEGTKIKDMAREEIKNKFSSKIFIENFRNMYSSLIS